MAEALKIKRHSSRDINERMDAAKPGGVDWDYYDSRLSRRIRLERMWWANVVVEESMFLQKTEEVAETRGAGFWFGCPSPMKMGGADLLGGCPYLAAE